MIFIAAGVCFAFRNKSKNGSTGGESTTSNGAESPDIHYPFMQVVDQLNFQMLVLYDDKIQGVEFRNN